MDFPLWQKCIITFVCNLLGVFIVKLIEEKMEKDKLWKVEVTVPAEVAEKVEIVLNDISHSKINIDKEHTLFNFYCQDKGATRKVMEICDQFNGKYFASECKLRRG